uniref:Uncharacterized protein n=1 Tax=Arundo donax TaxID=35708 RepID=A0A0A9AAT4_ARUDO
MNCICFLLPEELKQSKLVSCRTIKMSFH